MLKAEGLTIIGVTMNQVPSHDYGRVAFLFRELAELHLSVGAVLGGTAPGEIWVNSLEEPAVGFAETPEGQYLTGDPQRSDAYPGLYALIPEKAYLTIHPLEWASVMPQIWSNPAVRPHKRFYLRFQEHQLPDWRRHVPHGFTVAPIDRAFLQRTDLQNLSEMDRHVEGWHSQEDFLQHGFGFCVILGDRIVSRCIADCALGAAAEIGVGTASDFRGRGLASLVVAAAVEHALARGLTQIGWHCLRGNTGSRMLAEKIGFRLTAEYNAYITLLPAENATDLTQAEYRDWAEHYERFVETSFWYRLFAAEAWALAGEPERALRHLNILVSREWQGDQAWLAGRWKLQGLRELPEFHAILAAVREKP
jgi:RimJ/RimL family protein N-acetyltransferase